MERPLFTVPVADLETGDRELDEPIPVDWLTATLAGTEAVPRGEPGQLEVTLSKSGREVMVRGHARAKVTMPCARTLDPVDFDLSAEIFLLLAPGASPVPPKHKPKKIDKRVVAGAPAAKKPGRKARDEDPALEEDTAAKDTYDGDKIVLDPFVREFLLLELPMVPLREDLRSEGTPAIERPPEPAVGGRPERETVDPRLAPLAAIASRLRAKKE